MSTKSDDPLVLCEWARDVGRSNAFLDIHVHPYDVLSGDIRYKPDLQARGLYTRNLFSYHPPVLEAGQDPPPLTNQFKPDNKRAFVLAARYTYNHTGPKVIEDQISLVGLKGALLLPVARTAGKAEEMLAVTHELFQMNERLFPGCAFPIGIEPDGLAVFFRWAYKTYGIRAIKLHPNLAGIDLLTRKGEDLICAALSIAGELNLPLVVHGGYTPSIDPAEGRDYGMISRMAKINWSISTAPVILAHAGCYGLSQAESMEALLIVNGLLDKYSNLMVDISALEPPVLHLVLNKISPQRIVFGSDALYIPVWKAWVMFLQALRKVSAHPDDDLIRIASINPAHCLSI